jgi:hypothetical protein
MIEERKHAIPFAATILSARRIQESMMSGKPDMAKQFYIDKAIEEAANILERIDQRSPTYYRDSSLVALIPSEAI